MVKQPVDKELRKNLIKAKKLIDFVNNKDANEAETRTCIYNIFEWLGYTRFSQITQEYATTESGDAERCDLAIKLDDNSPPKLLVEVKRVKTPLSKTHLRQIGHYAIDKGCEWAVLTNGKDWQLHHITYDQPPELTLVHSWNILEDDIGFVTEKFELIAHKNLKRGILEQQWKEQNTLTPHNLLKTILSKDSMALIRRSLKRVSGVAVSPEAVVDNFRRLLNNSALSELENIKISLGDKKTKKKVPAITHDTPKEEILPSVDEENKKEVS